MRTLARPVRGQRAVLPIVLTVVAAVALVACGSGDVPYEDKQAVGLIALYDRSGHLVTKGSVNDKPFVAKAVSAEKAPPPYDKPGCKAALLAFQPRKGVDPAVWEGDFLTGSTAYADAGHPTATGTDQDISLANVIAVFPPAWDGLLQLRMYLGAPEEPGRTSPYVTADIKVDGDTWTLVRGASDIPGGVPSDPAATATGS